jgi:SAM-dependent methyltransferase
MVKQLLKRVVPGPIKKVLKEALGGSRRRLPLTPALPLPQGVSEGQLQSFVESVRVSGAPAAEMSTYARQDFRRFVYTWGLVRELDGRCLELGANPYFTTMLLRHLTPLELTLANYFRPEYGAEVVQEVNYCDLYTGAAAAVSFHSHHFNVEGDAFPFADASYDVVLFCEILEHLLMDPARVLLEIKRLLRPGGVLVLTTPNVNRLENVGRMLAGVNVYDPYSGYGPYGRHNREYNKHELSLLLRHLGFELEKCFSADVHENLSEAYLPVRKYAHLLKHRQYDLGQYLFVRARSQRPARAKKPAFLYRSYSGGELE